MQGNTGFTFAARTNLSATSSYLKHRCSVFVALVLSVIMFMWLHISRKKKKKSHKRKHDSDDEEDAADSIEGEVLHSQWRRVRNLVDVKGSIALISRTGAYIAAQVGKLSLFLFHHFVYYSYFCVDVMWPDLGDFQASGSPDFLEKIAKT